MTFAILAASLATLAGPAAPTQGWKADILSDDAAVRAPVVARMRAKGRPGLYAVQDLVISEPTPADRAKAIRALAELGNADADWALRTELRQPSPLVAAAAVRAAVALHLGDLSKLVVARVGDPDADLCAALGDAVVVVPKVAEAARGALAGAPAAQLAGLEVLSAAKLPVPPAEAQRLMGAPLPLVRLMAAEASSAESAEPVLEKLATEPGTLGDRAAKDLSTMGTPAGIAALAAIAGSGVAPERAIAALASAPAGLVALLRLRDQSGALAHAIDDRFASHPPATADLLAVGQGPKGPAAQQAIHLLASRADGIQALDGCVQTLAATADRCALGLTSTPAADPTFARELTSADVRVRVIAGRAMAAASEPPKVDRLAALAADAEPEVRVVAAAGLGRVGPDGLPALRTLVHDPVEEVRTAAAQQLAAQLPVDELAGLVTQTLEDDAVRPYLLPAVARLPAAAAVQLLRTELRRGMPAERQQAVRELARLNDPQAVDALMAVASRDPDADTRWVAARVLGN